jgi:dienelactone hydrolase
MAHGTAGTMTFGLDRYARRFSEAGFAVLVFDYRHFGASEGQPRQLIDVSEQLDDWAAALAYVRSLTHVDRHRIAVWGTSLSAGHVVNVAAHDTAVAAVVAQLPFFGVELGRSSPRTASVTMKLFGAAMIDTVRGWLGRPPKSIAMVGPPGAVAVFTGTEDYEVARQLAESAPDWRNEIAARSLWSLTLYRPARTVSQVTVPLLVCIAEDDTAAAVPLALRSAAKAKRSEVRRYPGGHFAAYVGPVFEQMVTDEIDFLRRHVGNT